MKKDKTANNQDNHIARYFLKEFGHSPAQHSFFSQSENDLTNTFSVAQNLDSSPFSNQNNAVSSIRKGDFKQALLLHHRDVNNNDLLICIDACLGVAKCFLHLGYLASSVRWASLGMAIARHHEISFKMASALWLRGCAFMRGGYFQKAYECFSFDYAILPPGHPQRVYAICMQAYSVSYMGNETSLAAEYMYRIASYTLSKESPMHYAYSGLALLGAQSNKKELIAEATEKNRSCSNPYIQFRMKVAHFLANEQSEDAFKNLVQYASKLDPRKYCWEIAWIQNCCKNFKINFQTQNITSQDIYLPAANEHCFWSLVSDLESEPAEVHLPDSGIGAWQWSDNFEMLLKQRICILL